MKEFSLPLISQYTRPVIELFHLPALIDTGAIIPEISMYPAMFEKIIDTKIISPNEEIIGICGREKGAVYSISNFQIGELIFKDFEIFVPDEPKLQFPFLISANLFHGMIYEVDTVSKKFTVRTEENLPLQREFKLKKFKGELYPQIDGVLFEDTEIFLRDCQIFF